MDEVCAPFARNTTSNSTVPYRVLLCLIGEQRKRPDHRTTSYNRALEMTGCESIENTVRTKRLRWAETLIRKSGRRLPKRVVFGNLENEVRRGRGGKEKEWIDCVQSDVRASSIAYRGTGKRRRWSKGCELRR